MSKQIRLDLTPRQIKALGDRVLIAVVATDVCTGCDETSTSEQRLAHDPSNEDHCPHCDRRWCMTTYYGNVDRWIGETELADDPASAFVIVVKRRAKKGAGA